MEYLKKIIHSLFTQLGIFENYLYLIKIVPDNPLKVDLSKKYIYIVGTSCYQKWAYFLCPLSRILYHVFS